MNIKMLITKLLRCCFKHKKSVNSTELMSNKYIISDFFPIEELYSTLSDLISTAFKIFPKNIENSIDELKNLLRDDINCYIEYPYVEKVYRDSYYNYYSTKHNSTLRNCARISFFNNDISITDFRTVESNKIQNSFMGYMTIRPTLPNLIGRTMISPLAYRQNNNLYCLTNSEVVINGVRLTIRAFPHSSQDGETITCAETTIWSVMEYFGTRYPEYKPVLPSKIIAALSNYSYERQLPSRGLTSEQISYALKEFDFGTRLYALAENSQDEGEIEAYGEKEFKRLLGYYVESGIPIIAGIENDSLGHALIIMGHKKITVGDIDLTEYQPIEINSKNGIVYLYDYADLINDFVVIDDNMPPYNTIPFENPTHNYDTPQFEGCKIKNFIAPLYHKIYLEAGGAKELSISYLENFNHDLPGNKIILKLFCISSRSFKAELNNKVNIGVEANEIILSLTMPKFIWIGLFTNTGLLKQSKANGLVILDATETNIEDALILMVSPNGLITYDSQDDLGFKYTTYDLEINNFNIFANNLKES